MTDHDPLLDDLTRLDPARADTPPAPGSDRHARILEKAMLDTYDRDTEVDARRHPGRLLLTAAAVLVVVAVAVALAGRSDDDIDRADGPTTTTAPPFDADSLRYRTTYERPEGTTVVEGEANGRDSRFTFRADDGSTGDSTIVDGVNWYSGSDEPERLADADIPASFPDAAAAVLGALRSAESTTSLGTEEVAGVTAEHLSITLGASGTTALSDLPNNQLSWFDLETSSRIAALDVWIADDLIRRVVVVGDDGSGEGTQTVTAEFLDIGAPVTIEPPG